MCESHGHGDDKTSDTLTLRFINAVIGGFVCQCRLTKETTM